MRIAIVGASGTVGAETVRVLRARGHDVRVLGSGPGLAEALLGVEVAVDASRGGFVDGTRRLLSAERDAGVGHHVGVSIVGVDRMGGPYYRRKLAQEAAIRAGGVPWTILRATQLHTLVAAAFAKSAKLGVLPSVSAPLQPVDPAEVGRALADTAECEPSFAITQFAGPEVVTVQELAHRWRTATGSHAVPVRLPATRSLRSGGLTNPG